MSSDQLKDVESDKIVTNYDEVVDSFDALGLKEQLLRGIFISNYFCCLRANLSRYLLLRF